MLGVLGVDVDAPAWATTVAEERLLPLLITLLLALMLIELLRRAGTPPHRRPHARRERARVSRRCSRAWATSSTAPTSGGRLVMASPSFASLSATHSVDDATRHGPRAASSMNTPRSARRSSRAWSADGLCDRLRGHRAPSNGAHHRGSRAPATSTVMSAGRVQGVEGVPAGHDGAQACRCKPSPRPRNAAGNLLESVGDGILGVDRRGHVTFMNPAAEQMLGWTADGAARHRACTTPIHYAREDGSRLPATSSARSTSPMRTASSAVSTTRSCGARTAPASRSSTSLDRSCEDGELTGAIISFRDISERRAWRLALEGEPRRLTSCCAPPRSASGSGRSTPDHIIWDETVGTLYGLPPERQRWSLVRLRRLHPSRRPGAP